MQKILWIALVAALAVGTPLWGQSITVNQPANNSERCQGSNLAIAWTSSGITGDVSIHLIPADPPGAGSLMILVAPTANDGSHSWTIPASYPVGYYRIRVQSGTGGNVVKGDSGRFRIKPCASISQTGKTLQNVSKPAPQAMVQMPPAPNLQYPSYANLISFKVNGQSTSSHTNRIVCHRAPGIQMQANAVSSVQPISYRFKIDIDSPYDNFSHNVYDSGWISQNQATFSISYNQFLAKIAPSGVPAGSTIMMLYYGEATVYAKNNTQAEPPQTKQHAIKFWID